MTEHPTAEAIGPRKGARKQFVIRMLTGLGLLGLVLYFVDFREAADILVYLNPWYVLLVVVLFYLDRGLMAYKWRPLLSALDVRVPLFALIRIYLTASMAAVFLPSTIGGDLFRVYSLSRYRVNVEAVLASIFIERSLGFLAMLLLAIVSLGIASYLLRDSWNEFVGIAWLLIGGALIGVPLTAGLLLFLGKWFQKRRRRPVKLPGLAKLRQVFAMSYQIRKHPRTLVVVGAWTFLEQLSSVAVTFLLVQALHIDVAFLELLAVIPIIVLFIRIPISFEGLGVQEGLYVVLLALVGVSAAEALVLSAITRAIFTLCALPWGIHYLFIGHRKPLTLQRVGSIR